MSREVDLSAGKRRPGRATLKDVARQADVSVQTVSNVVNDLCLGKGLSFDDAGSRDLKGFSAPVHTHAVKLNC